LIIGEAGRELWLSAESAQRAELLLCENLDASAGSGASRPTLISFVALEPYHGRLILPLIGGKASLRLYLPSFSSHHEMAWRRPRRDGRVACGITGLSAEE